VIDPRLVIVDERMKDVKRIIAVSSGKGGVGKSIIASALALELAKKNYRVGLFDLDFTSPSAHIILGIEGLQPKEEKGIIPPRTHGIRFMSITYYSGDLAAPLRGADVSNALIELLAITRWGKLDYLILDMPPGIGDATLDLIRLIKNITFLIVTTSSQLAFETVKKLVSLLRSQKVAVLGVVENMKIDKSTNIQRSTEKLGLEFITEIPYDLAIEEAIGETDKLMRTSLARKIDVITSRI
jgi:ATP-binding protein involved in chromosome partitioning